MKSQEIENINRIDDGKRMDSNPAVGLEEERLKHISGVEDFDMFHERHRIFPAIFEDRKHKKVIDISAGIGAAANRVNKYYNADLVCNELSPKCLDSLKNLNLKTVSFDLDDNSKPYPFKEKEFDAIISLATIEHLYNIDNFFYEAKRILKDNGYIYISVPNYNGLNYLIPLLFRGKTFHDPLNPKERYEFYGHLRYFTHLSLIKYVSSFGFTAEAVYLGKPKKGTRYLRFKSKHKIGAALYKVLILALFYFFPPRWSPEPVICFKKNDNPKLVLKPRKKIL
ncbi:MAG: class I SAM-dependent methyltransferase [Candidatus Lokiarchaeia archaeon]|nr:class I SAM-dependent methyltransferase [Candidatus Lokiarchaeia archaeon]